MSKKKEQIIFEKISLKSKNEYSDSILFKRKNDTAYMQILILNHYLSENNSSIEILINSFVDKYINTKYSIKRLKLNFPSVEATYSEKIRILAPELDFLLKQYQNYVFESQIDFELISIDSNPIRFSEIKSLVNKKYVYINSEEVKNLKYYFFSDQSSLYYTKKYENTYTNFYDLLSYENVKLSDFENYQLHIINQLINLKYVYVDESENVKISRDIMLYIIRELNDDEVISYWYYPDTVREEIDQMVNSKLLKFENTLFTKPEINYFNYYLNKKEFTNGLDLRNKYLHGTNRGSESINEYEYYILIKLVLLIIMKIEDDLSIHESLQKA